MNHTSKPLTLTIVIPAFNEEKLIKDCLDSIENQTEMPDEVILVDNNCTDATVEIAKKYKFVKVVKESKQGIVYARTTGFNSAKGHIIGRIDADTLLPKNWVQKIKTFYSDPANHKKAITGCGSFRNLIAIPPKINFMIQNLITFRFNRFILGHYILWGANMAMTKKQWQVVKTELCDDHDMHEDLDLAIHLNNKNYEIIYKPKLAVSVIMKRAFSDYSELWPNLMWWPKTVKKHHNPRWILGFLGAVFLYVVSFVVAPINIVILHFTNGHK